MVPRKRKKRESSEEGAVARKPVVGRDGTRRANELGSPAPRKVAVVEEEREARTEAGETAGKRRREIREPENGRADAKGELSRFSLDIVRYSAVHDDDDVLVRLKRSGCFSALNRAGAASLLDDNEIRVLEKRRAIR